VPRRGWYKTQKHGMSNTPTYRSWANMLHRCQNPRVPSYRHYGAKGITVCKRWLLFKNFLADMGVRPKGRTLDRIKNHLGYKPSNCRWATHRQQINNRGR
jgi:GrpB-like predicted nucleotidyltransferase (UPF0157 family)